MTITIDISFEDCTGKSFSYKSLSGLIRFFEREKTFWISKSNEITQSPKCGINDIHTLAKAGKEQVCNVHERLKDLNQQKETLTVDQIESAIQQIFRANINSQCWLWSKHLFTKHYVDCHIKFGSRGANAFYNFYHGNTTNVSRSDEVCGVIFAYRLKHQKSDLTESGESEKAALSTLAEDLQKTTEDMFSEAEVAKSKYIDWHNEEVKEKWESWFKSSTEKYDQFIRDSENERAELEKVYEEHLRLKKPAEYWGDSAASLKRQGFLYLFALLVFVCAGIFTTYLIYDSWASNAKDQILNLHTFHGVVIFATMVTIFGFGIRVLSKLVLSSFHLMRDAQERRTLAMLYLSLSREKVIDESSRDIVLQALFSRAEIGLIDSNSSPTLPGISDLLGSSNK